MIQVYFEPWIFSKYGYKAEAVLLESYDEEEYTIEQIVDLIEDRMRQNNLNVTKKESETEVMLIVRTVICDSAIYNLGEYIIKKGVVTHA